MPGPAETPQANRGTATALSRSDSESPGFAAPTPEFGRFGGLARSSQMHLWVRAFSATLLSLWMLMLSSSCLVTSSPEFQDPQRTAPFLDPEHAFPDPRQVIVIESSVQSLALGALVRSEDVQAPLETRLLLDYGWSNPSNGKPFRREVAGDGIGASTFDDETRFAEVNWDPISVPMAPGCHRLTLMVSHGFSGETGCATTLGDYSQITWTVLRCAAEGCPTIDLTDTQKVDEEDPSCPPVDATCAAPEGLGGGTP